MNIMKKKSLYLTMFVVALLASCFIITTSKLTNVSACVQAPGCIEQNHQPKGVLSVNNYGFPVTYKQTVTFSPVNSNEKASNYAGFASASTDTKTTNVLDIIINITFWLGLIYSVNSIVLYFRAKSQ